MIKSRWCFRGRGVRALALQVLWSWLFCLSWQRLAPTRRRPAPRPFPEGGPVAGGRLMFSFKCPGCHATHFANEQFQGLRAKCLRCGEVLMVGEKQPRR